MRRCLRDPIYVASLIQYRLVTDRQMYRQTDRHADGHDDSKYHASIASRGKKGFVVVIQNTSLLGFWGFSGLVVACVSFIVVQMITGSNQSADNRSTTAAVIISPWAQAAHLYCSA